MEVVDKQCRMEVESCSAVPTLECNDVQDQVEKEIPREVWVDVTENPQCSARTYPRRLARTTPRMLHETSVPKLMVSEVVEE